MKKKMKIGKNRKNTQYMDKSVINEKKREKKTKKKRKKNKIKKRIKTKKLSLLQFS